MKSPLAVGFVAFFFYASWLVLFLGSGHDARTLIHANANLIFHAGAVQHGSAIHYDPHFPYVGNNGYYYDGQWFYLMALDPVNARYYVDQPTYRYTKPLYPLLAHVLALGKADLIPYTLVFINLVAIALGTLCLAAWLKRRAVSPWLALGYAAYCGLFTSYRSDLTEPMAYALILVAIYLLDVSGRYRYVLAGTSFSLAVLTRDKSAIFAGAYGLAIIFTPSVASSLQTWKSGVARNLPGAVTLLTLALGPLLAYRLFLRLWLGQFSSPVAQQSAPLQGVLDGSIPTSALTIEAFVVFIPSAICGGLAIWALWKRVWKVEILLILVNIQLGLVTLAPEFFRDFRGVTRVGIAIVVSALLSIPYFDRIVRRRALWLVPCLVCWTLLTIVWGLRLTAT